MKRRALNVLVLIIIISFIVSIFLASIAGALNDTNEVWGACLVKDSSTGTPSALDPDVGLGYAKVHIKGVNNIAGLRSKCDDNVLNDIFLSYCLGNYKELQYVVVTFNEEGDVQSSACDDSGCEEWFDRYRRSHSIPPKTLLKQETEDAKVNNLEGNFNLNIEDLNVKSNDSVSINSEEKYSSKILESNPSHISKAEDRINFRTYSEEDQQNSISFGQILDKGHRILDYVKDPLIKIISFMIYLLACFLIYFGSYNLYIHNKWKKAINYHFLKRVGQVYSMKLKKIMTSNVITVSKSDSVMSALHKMVDHYINSVVVMRGEKIVGIVSEDDFLKFAYTKKNFKKLKIKDIMTSKVITIDGNSSVLNGMKTLITNKIRKLPITEKGKLVGIITVTDFLETYKGFFSKNMVQGSNMPTVKSIYSKEIVKVDQIDKLSSIFDKMLRNDCGIAIVYKKVWVKAQDKIFRQAIGVITTKDLLDEYYNNPDSIDKVTAIHVMKSPIITVNPGKDVIEVNQLMLDKDIRRLPVIVNNDFIGVLTQSAILASLYYLIKDASLKIDKRVIKNKLSG